MYEIFTNDPDRGARFGMFFNQEDEPSSFLLENYPWEEFTTVVDVGGGHGSVATAIAERFPAIKCIVQDLPETAKEGEIRLSPLLKDRVDFMTQYVRPRPLVHLGNS
jgi:ubiquinone/menaquinone biosynthesis C-methylase UbiE